MSTKWEYKIESVPKVDDIIFVLNKLGGEGWELIQLTGSTCILKRERDETKKREGGTQYRREVPQTGHPVG